jgi:predicted RNA-binding protein with PIN domain
MTYIIDGYNLIGAMNKISLADPDKESKVITLLNKNPLTRKNKLVVIFDGKGDLATTETRLKIGKITVIYTDNSRDADDLIKDKLHMATAGQTVLVSSDRELINRAKKYRIKAVTSPSFIKLIFDTAQTPEKLLPEKPQNPETDYWMSQFNKKKY